MWTRPDPGLSLHSAGVLPGHVRLQGQSRRRAGAEEGRRRRAPQKGWRTFSDDVTPPQTLAPPGAVFVPMKPSQVSLCSPGSTGSVALEEIAPLIRRQHGGEFEMFLEVKTLKTKTHRETEFFNNMKEKIKCCGLKVLLNLSFRTQPSYFYMWFYLEFKTIRNLIVRRTKVGSEGGYKIFITVNRFI